MNNNFELNVFSTIEDICLEAVNIFIELLNSGEKNNFIVLGGKTPHLFYHFLSQQVRSWLDITLILSDERLVGVNTPESNFGMIKCKLLDHIKRKSGPKLIPVFNDFSKDQSSRILEALNSSTHSLLPPKAAFLGIGTDGHTASLFPGHEESFFIEDPFFILHRHNEPFQRLSVSMKILSETPLLVFLVAGKVKKNILRQIVNEHCNNSHLPVQRLINKAQGKVIILCDQDADPNK
jgi:6-phosphogluconolactonase